MEIREARADEYGEAGRVTADAYREYFAPGAADEDHRYLARIRDIAGRADRTTILIAIDEGAIVGTLTLELDGRVGNDEREDRPLEPGEAHIRMLGVAPAARARGAGRALMLEAQSRARAAGKTEITLHTTNLMTAAQVMYRELGYERTADEVMPDGFVLLGYRKPL